jgi:hypothetical protein
MKHSCGFSEVLVFVVTMAITSGCAPGSIVDRGSGGKDDGGRMGAVDAKLDPAAEREEGSQQPDAPKPWDASLAVEVGAGPSGVVSGDGGSGSAGGPGGSGRESGRDGAGSGGNDGSSGGGGHAGYGGQGDAMGSDDTRPNRVVDPSDASRPGDGPNGSSMAVNAWSGKWAGEFRFTVDSVKDPLNELQWVGRSWGLAMGVDELAVDEASDGWAPVNGRLASSDCLLTGALNAMAFVGDSIAFISAPLFIGSGGGVDRNGQPVAVTIAGERHGDSIVGKISFESQNPLAPFCDGRHLEFSLFRTR